MQSQDLKNSILLICLDTESETLLFPNHPSRVEFGWNYMLEKLEIDSNHLTAQQKAMILDARSIINQSKILDDPSENLKEFNKKFKQTLVSFPQDPKGLIRESLRVINQDNPEFPSEQDVEKANLLFLNGFYESLKDAKKSDLATEISKLDTSHYTILRAPHKREIIPTTPRETELMNQENKILGFTNVINFGIQQDGKRKNNLQEIIGLFQKTIVIIDARELKRIDDILSNSSLQDKDIYQNLVAKIKDSELLVIDQLPQEFSSATTKHFIDCQSSNLSVAINFLKQLPLKNLTEIKASALTKTSQHLSK